MRSTVSSKGQITLPVAIRARLGLVTGTPVDFEVRDGEVILRKGVRGAHPVDRIFGRLQLGKPVDALLDEMRGARPSRSSTVARRWPPPRRGSS
jgi:antitoxin PrlF